MRRPTLETVAAHAGVSRPTVSGVVNGSPKVSDEVRARVEAAARELGYTPDTAARTLATSRSGTVAIVVCEPDSRAFSDPWFGEVTRGARRELTAAGLNLVVVIAPDAADQERCADHLRGAHVDGALLLSLHEWHPLPRLLARAGLPTVVLGRPPDSASALPYVDIANARTPEPAGRGRGPGARHRIGVIAGPQDMPAARDRLDGYRAALGADFRPSRVEIGDYTRRHGRRAMAALLDREPDLDAVFVPSDTMALGAQRAIRGTGRRTPDDIAVIGFHDIET